MDQLDQDALRRACHKAQTAGWTIKPGVFVDRENLCCCPSGAWQMFKDCEATWDSLSGFPAGFDGVKLLYERSPEYMTFYNVGQAFRAEFCP